MRRSLQSHQKGVLSEGTGAGGFWLRNRTYPFGARWQPAISRPKDLSLGYRPPAPQTILPVGPFKVLASQTSLVLQQLKFGQVSPNFRDSSWLVEFAQFEGRSLA